MPNPKRCAWAGSEPLMCRYHDEEWGVPVHDDRRLFSRAQEDLGPVGTDFAHAVMGIRAALDILSVPATLKPGPENGSSGRLPPGNVLARS